MSEPTVAAPIGQVMWFVDNALDQMAVILRDLGDGPANQRPPLEGTNSPYAILTHCLGVMEYWGGLTVADRAIERDRAAEFVASGTVSDLLGRAAAARRQLELDLEKLESAAPPCGRQGDGAPYDTTQGSVVLHILEELYQHLGQMELTRDLLLTP